MNNLPKPISVRKPTPVEQAPTAPDQSTFPNHLPEEKLEDQAAEPEKAPLPAVEVESKLEDEEKKKLQKQNDELSARLDEVVTRADKADARAEKAEKELADFLGQLQASKAMKAEPKALDPNRKITAVKAVHPFKFAYNGQVVSIAKDQLIFDSLHIERCLKGGLPVVPADEHIDYQICPKCFHKYS